MSLIRATSDPFDALIAVVICLILVRTLAVTTRRITRIAAVVLLLLFVAWGELAMAQPWLPGWCDPYWAQWWLCIP